MRRALSHGWVRLLFVVGVLGILIVIGFGVYLSSVAGDLPWQVEPTRIPITPFADAPGFTPPKIIVATPTGS
jgi:hypothetical protein